MIPAEQALRQLIDGNRRYVEGRARGTGKGRPSDLSGGQAPMATILGCSDSRVPLEIIFDQGPGDLFVIRVVGNIASPIPIGSIEYAASEFGTRLVVVLGHQNCGAVATALEQLRAPMPETSPHLEAILEHVRPALQVFSENPGREDVEGLLQRAVEANVIKQTEKLRAGSTVLRRLEREDGLLIVSATYSVENGAVEFLQGE